MEHDWLAQMQRRASELLTGSTTLLRFVGGELDGKEQAWVGELPYVMSVPLSRPMSATDKFDSEPPSLNMRVAEYQQGILKEDGDGKTVRLYMMRGGGNG